MEIFALDAIIARILRNALAEVRLDRSSAHLHELFYLLCIPFTGGRIGKNDDAVVDPVALAVPGQMIRLYVFILCKVSVLHRLMVVGVIVSGRNEVVLTERNMEPVFFYKLPCASPVPGSAPEKISDRNSNSL